MGCLQYVRGTGQVEKNVCKVRRRLGNDAMLRAVKSTSEAPYLGLGFGNDICVCRRAKIPL